MRYVDGMGPYDERPPRPLIDFPQDGYKWDDTDEEGIKRLLNPPRPVRLDATTLYRYFDENGALLYVGITNHASLRVRQHSNYSRWWPAVRSATFEHFATRADALAAELTAIEQERPPHNVVGHPDRKYVYHGRRRWFQVCRLDRSYESETDNEAGRKMRVLLTRLAERGWPTDI